MELHSQEKKVFLFLLIAIPEKLLHKGFYTHYARYPPKIVQLLFHFYKNHVHKLHLDPLCKSKDHICHLYIFEKSIVIELPQHTNRS